MIPIIILSIKNDDDREFMIALYIKLFPIMKSTAMKIVKDASSSEDVIQDALVSLIRNVSTLQKFDKNRLTAYVIQAVGDKKNIKKNRSI